MRWRAMPRSARRHGIVPIVEPEVLMDGDHDIERCDEVTELGAEDDVPGALRRSASRWKAWCSSRTWSMPGKKCGKQASVEEVAEQDRAGAEGLRAGRGAGHRLPLRRPERRGGDRPSRRHEQDRASCPGALTFSYGRALQHAPQTTWAGKRERRRRAARLRPPRQDEQPRQPRPVESRPGEEGGVSVNHPPLKAGGGVASGAPERASVIRRLAHDAPPAARCAAALPLSAGGE